MLERQHLNHSDNLNEDKWGLMHYAHMPCYESHSNLIQLDSCKVVYAKV